MHQHHQRLRQNRDSPPLLPPPPLDTRGGFGTFGAFTRGTSTLGAVNGIAVWGHRFEFAAPTNAVAASGPGLAAMAMAMAMAVIMAAPASAIFDVVVNAMVEPF